MRVSEIQEHRIDGVLQIQYVETPTDALRVIRSMRDVRMYIDQFGDVEIVYNRERDCYEVPEFADAVQAYTEAKARDCAIWGCE